MALPITFLSDYGYADEFAGVCRAVIAGIAPDARLIDLTHGIPPQGVRQGAIVLAGALPFSPVGVHLAVVDPGVGTERRAVAVETGDGRRLVGPDNGLLAPAMERLGGAVRAADVSASPLRLEPVSATFHGRDVLAPVAAHLANGLDLEEAGATLDPAELVELTLARATVEPGRVVARVAVADRFGNLALNLAAADLAASGLEAGGAFTVKAGSAEAAGTYGRTFADVPAGEIVLYRDSTGAMALAVNGGSAAERLGARLDDEILLVVA